MAKPYLIYKTSNGVYYAELLLPDGTHANKKSTGCRNRAEAEKVVMGWVVNGNIPSRINGKENHKTNVYYMFMKDSYGDASLSDNPKNTDWLLSVRCLKDAK